MSNIFTFVITEAGEDAMRAAGGAVGLNLTHLAFGDTGYLTRDNEGNPTVGARTATALLNELVRIPIAHGGDLGPKQILLLGTLPGGTPQFSVREFGVFTDTGVLWAVGAKPTGAYFERSDQDTAVQFVYSWTQDGDINVVVNGDAITTLLAIENASVKEAHRGVIEGAGLTYVDGDTSLLHQAVAFKNHRHPATEIDGLDAAMAGKLDVGATAADSSKLGGQNASYYASQAEVDGKLNSGDTAVNASRLGNQLPAHFATKAQVDAKLGSGDTAANANRLGNQLPSHYATASQLAGKLGSSEKAADSNLLDGHDSTYFATQTDLNNRIPATGVAADAAQFGGHAPSHYATQVDLGTKLGATATAVDSDKLGGHASSYYAPMAEVYDRNTLDNKFTELLTGLNWKDGVNTFADLATTYPTPQEGWVADVADTDSWWRYDATEGVWKLWNQGLTPLATSSINGLMAAVDKFKLDSINLQESAVAGSVPLRDSSGHLRMNNALTFYVHLGHAVNTRSTDTEFFSGNGNGYIYRNTEEGFLASLDINMQINPVAQSVVRRDDYGDVHARQFRGEHLVLSHTASQRVSDPHLITSDSSGVLRKNTPAGARRVIGLGNVANVAPADLIVSDATQAELDKKFDGSFRVFVAANAQALNERIYYFDTTQGAFTCTAPPNVNGNAFRVVDDGENSGNNRIRIQEQDGTLILYLDTDGAAINLHYRNGWKMTL